jgi:uncharacterized SAM-binding protein YcdF (DUF218 family)
MMPLPRRLTHNAVLAGAPKRGPAEMRPNYMIPIFVPVAVIVLGATLFLAREPILLATGDLLAVQDELHPADVIHVISEPDDRTDNAIQLYKQGYARQLSFTGGWCTFHSYYHGQHGRESALGQGVPFEAVAVHDSRVASTYSEVVKLKEFITQSQAPIHSAIGVSDPHQMWRARWTNRQVLGDQVDVQTAHVPFEASRHQRRSWADEESRRMVWNEYRKIAYYYARYRSSWGPVRERLASLDQN